MLGRGYFHGVHVIIRQFARLARSKGFQRRINRRPIQISLRIPTEIAWRRGLNQCHEDGLENIFRIVRVSHDVVCRPVNQLVILTVQRFKLLLESFGFILECCSHNPSLI